MVQLKCSNDQKLCDNKPMEKKKKDVLFIPGLRCCNEHIALYGGFLKWWVSPTTIGVPTKNHHFAVEILGTTIEGNTHIVCWLVCVCVFVCLFASLVGLFDKQFPRI